MTIAPEPPSRLIQETRSTPAALVHLEKGIRLLFKKDFRKAHEEFQDLLKRFSQEKEICAKARSYVQICEREGAHQRKASVTNDQLYSVGIVEHNRGNYDVAIAHFRKSLEQKQDADFILYALAASLALKGDAAGAVEALDKAIALNEENRIYAKNDSDFLSLHANGRFAGLVGLTHPPLDRSRIIE